MSNKSDKEIAAEILISAIQSGDAKTSVFYSHLNNHGAQHVEAIAAAFKVIYQAVRNPENPDKGS